MAIQIRVCCNSAICGATNSPCTANSMLKRTADDKEDDFDFITLETLRRNYVDDVLRAVSTSDATIKLSNHTEVCARGGFNFIKFTKFMSNDRRVLSAEIPLEKRATPSLNLDLDELPVQLTVLLEYKKEH